MEKGQIVAQLYALRAGLSVISQKADEVRICEKDTTKCKSSKVDMAKNIDRKLNEFAEKTKNFKEERDGEIIGYKRWSEETFDFLIFGIICAVWIFFCGFPLIGVSAILLLPQGNKLGYLLIAVCVGVPLIVLVVMKAKLNKENKWRDEENAKNKKERLEFLERELYGLSAEIQDLQKSKITSDKDFDGKIEVNNNKISVLAKESEVCDKALVEQYGKFINAADWKNIDLIIFYLQTGRADNMKEALQLADRQRQTDAIVNEIRQAAFAISSEIKSGLRALGGALVQCFNLLSKQIESQTSALLDSQQKMSEELSTISKQNKQLISNSQLNSALQAKANMTSDQLKDDLEFMQYKMGYIK